jgi:hypothetical protein
MSFLLGYFLFLIVIANASVQSDVFMLLSIL